MKLLSLRIFEAFCLVLLLWPLPQSVAAAAGWPEGFIVAEHSASSDGRFGVLIPSREAAPEEETDVVNYLANLKTHRLLGKIRGGSYSESRNHRGLRTVWADDSSWGVVQYDGRYGFDSIFVLEPHGSGFAQAEIGKLVQTSLDGVIAKAAHEKDAGCEGEVFYRLGPDRKVRLRALGMTNPKQLPNVTTYYALFQGTYDLKAGRWTVTDARDPDDQYDTLEAAYQKLDFSDRTFANDEERASALDELMNKVYQAIHFLLPANRFAQVKQEQIAWLKKRDAMDSVKGKCGLLEVRIKDLQDLLW